MNGLSYVLAQRLWQAVAGSVTLALVAVVFSPEQQGWYYSFLSVAALYTLFDLGLSIVLVQLAAHAFGDARWGGRGKLSGNAESFGGLLFWGARHYSVLAAVFLALLLPGGWWFFGQQATQALTFVEWRGPWVALVVATALNMIGIPYLAVVEGSGLVAQVYAVRLAQGVIGALGCWALLLAGGGLWALAAVPALATAVLWYWLLGQWPGLLAFVKNRPGAALQFSHEIWPLQWRVGLSWLSGYVLTQIYTPILLHFQGGVAAGQLGLSLTLVNMLGLLAQSWVTRHIPAMGMAAGSRDWKTLDRLFAADFKVSCLVFCGGVAILVVGRLMLAGHVLEVRLLEFWPLLILGLVGLINHMLAMLAAQLRSFRKEPLVWVSLAGAVLTAPCAILGAKFYGASGVILSIFAVQLSITLPVSLWLWTRNNKILRAEF